MSAPDPVLDADGLPVDLPASLQPSDTLRLFFSGRVRAPKCPHYMYRSERAAGLTTCEHCELDDDKDDDDPEGDLT